MHLGRFQLFGDTMNTASRMESTSLSNKMQVSQETADLLTAAGHQKWLTPRETVVHAKGKGALQTYFVTISAGSTVASSEMSNSHVSSSSDAVVVGIGHRKADVTDTVSSDDSQEPEADPRSEQCRPHDTPDTVEHV